MSSRSDAAAPALAIPRPIGVGLLVRTKIRAATNQLAQAVAEGPFRFALTAGFLILIWVALYYLFSHVFDYFKRTPLEAAVAIPLVFNFFFVALLVMLTVSNAIIAYMSLFAADEAAYLLSAPVPPRVYVSLKYIETLIFSSWSLVLLGLPLMMAMAGVTDEPWYYYPLFLAFFLCFVPIPGAAGLVVAWLAARFLTRRVRKRLTVTIALFAAAGIVWFIQSVQINEEQNTLWLKDFLFRVRLVRSAILPNSWVSKGVDAAMQYHTAEALSYLAVTLANALFLSWLGVKLVSDRFLSAFDTAQSMRGSDRRAFTEPVGGLAGVAFFYLPKRMRLVASKDLRTFLRDPLQWTQLLILFGLMILYLLNVPRFSGENTLAGWGMIIPFLNFGAISFILATFTSRFVFPLVSLEGHQLWLIGMLPLSAGQILLAKFAFALTVSVGVAVSTTILAAVMLGMPADWAALQVMVTFAVCVGLCGFAVGFGARLPMFGQRNAARIANGFGGTVNLIASVMMILVMLAGMGWMGIHNRFEGFDAPVDTSSVLIASAVALLGVVCGAVVMAIGARHLRRVEV